MFQASNNLEQAILKTIIYYDIFDYPLTSFEIYNWLFGFETKLFNVENVLNESLFLKKYIEKKEAFYFLKGRKAILNIRKNHRDFSVKKWKKARRVLRFLSFVPFVKMLALCNSMGYFNLNEDSDIDLFIVIKSPYIWLSRFLITFITHILGVRRYKNKIKNRICLSFYITDNNLEMKNLAYENDIYFYNWFLHLTPIFDLGIYQQIYKENTWLKNFFPQFSKIEIVDNFKVKDNLFSFTFRSLLEKILDNVFGKLLNKLLKKIQLLKMKKKSFQMKINKDVIISDSILKFHESDKRKHYRDIYLKRISSIKYD